MLCIADNFSSLASQLGVYAGQLQDENFRLDLGKAEQARTVLKLDSHVAKFDAAQGVQRSDSDRRDSAAAFLTSTLSAVLMPVELRNAYNFLFTPGMAQQVLVPVAQRVALGQQQVEWDALAITGEARRFAAGATTDLKRVGVSEDRRSQPVIWFGVRFGWNQFQLWQAQHIPGRSVESEQQRGAMMAMAEYFEDGASYGVPSAKVPGFFNGGSATSLTLPYDFGSSSITGAQIVTNCQILDIFWHRTNPNRVPTGVCMPRSHRVNMIGKFIGTNSEGANAWLLVKEAFPWLANIVEDDRLLTASPSGDAMWQMWSADGESQYMEGMAMPMVFGPFEREMNTEFIAIQQCGFFVNKDPRTVVRAYAPAA